MTTRIQIRRDFAAAWTASNPVLSSGEIGLEIDTLRLKFGDGASVWTALPYGTINTASSNNLAVFETSETWSVPAQLRVPGGKWKMTLIGGGGGGGGSGATAGFCGGGGGAGGGVIVYTSYVAGQNTVSITVSNVGGTAGTSSGNGGTGANTVVTYNGITYTASGGNGGTLNSAGGAGGGGTNGTLNIPGDSGSSGGTMAATSNYINDGGDSPFGLGFGGDMSNTSTGGVGIAGSGYGSGGSGGRTGTGTTARSGGAGRPGVVIIEY
jgi:hypothetical protein